MLLMHTDLKNIRIARPLCSNPPLHNNPKADREGPQFERAFNLALEVFPSARGHHKNTVPQCTKKIGEICVCFQQGSATSYAIPFEDRPGPVAMPPPPNAPTPPQDPERRQVLEQGVAALKNISDMIRVCDWRPALFVIPFVHFSPDIKTHSFLSLSNFVQNRILNGLVFTHSGFRDGSLSANTKEWRCCVPSRKTLISRISRSSFQCNWRANTIMYCIALHCIYSTLHWAGVFQILSFFNPVIPITVNILSPNCVFFPTHSICIDLNHVAPFPPPPQSPQPLVTAKPSSLQSLPSGKFSWEKAVAQTRCVTVGLYLHITARSHSYPLCTAHNA